MYLWKRFQFFDSAQAKESDGKSGLRVFRDFEPSCSCSGRGQLVYGDAKGVVRVLDHDMTLTHNFQAFQDSVVAVAQPTKQQRNVLIVLGHDHPDYPTLKFFMIDQKDDEGNFMEVKVKEFPVQCRGAPPPPAVATSLAVMPDLSQLVVGTTKGTVFMVSGDVLKRPTTSILVDKGPRVTGLHYLQTPNELANLFVVTSRTVNSYYIRNKGYKNALEKEGGGELGCSAINPRTSQLMVGRDKAVYLYSHDSKGICYGFDSDKKKVDWFSNYLVLVSKDSKRADTLTLYDLKNKFIAFNQKFDPIASVASEWGQLHVVTKSGKVFHLTEKDLSSKMQVLQRKHLYTIAVSLARSEKCDDSFIMGIYRQSADHKKDKGDYGGAMAEYLKTIGHVEPSYVIRQFLDAQRISHLTSYLEALHDHKIANKDHTTLLLKCYTKLKAPEKLGKFIRESKSRFDVETAIKVCHQAGYFDQALYLSEKHVQHSWYLRIQTEELKDSKKALQYIEHLTPDEQTRYLLQYGAHFIKSDAKRLTHILIKLCGKKTDRKQRPAAVTFVQVFIGRPRRMLEFLCTVVDQVPQTSPVVYNMLLELYLTIHLTPENSSSTVNKSGAKAVELTADQLKEKQANQIKAMQLLKSQQASYDINHALVAAKKHNFEKGMIYLYEKLRLYQDILQHYMSTNAHKKLIRTCINHGTSDPDLWVQALKYFAEKEDPCEDEIIQILDHIEDPKINLAPLMVVQILAAHEGKSFSVLKDYIIRILQRERDAIEQDEAAIEKFQMETQNMRKEIEDLTTKPTTFMPSRDLMLPAVHFLCKHSYHEQVIASRECPKCAPEFKNVMEIKEQVKQSASQHEQFFKMLEGSHDGFGVVAEYFGRGILDTNSS